MDINQYDKLKKSAICSMIQVEPHMNAGFIHKNPFQKTAVLESLPLFSHLRLQKAKKPGDLSRESIKQ